LTDTTRDSAELPAEGDGTKSVFQRKGLTYSNTFDSPFRRNLIRAIEWMTGKYKIVRMLKQFEREWPANGKTLWRAALDVMNIQLTTPQEQLDLIPESGPVVFVANHPHGLVDGMVMADLIGRRRSDYRILTRSVLTAIHEEAGHFMISVPFPHQPDAQEKMLEMRKLTLDHLRRGGCIALFPSGVVASSETMFGPAVEKEWNVFTAKLIRQSGAKVVPCFFPGSNSRWYQMADRISATLRQSLLLFEIVAACNIPQRPVIGAPLSDEAVKEGLTNPRQFMADLRDLTLQLDTDKAP
jgi:putative hemolysin